MSQKDKVFAQKKDAVQDFKFNKDIARVFDDMLNRSVPFYEEVQHMVSALGEKFVQDKTSVYDLGCSTGTTMAVLANRIGPRPVKYVGIDLSDSMLDKAREKLGSTGVLGKCTLLKADLNKPIKMKNASLVTMILTLQFVRPLYREELLKSIYKQLNPQGALILVEKILGENSTCNRVFIDLYYDFKKRQGYSELEISQKREALENVLIPYRLTEDIEMLKRSGFRDVDFFFRWYNFCGIVAIKQ